MMRQIGLKRRLKQAERKVSIRLSTLEMAHSTRPS